MNELKHKAFIYPGAIIPYLRHFMKSMENRIDFLNRDDHSNLGLFKIIKYIHQIDMFFLNWPEDIPEKKGGILQSLFYFALIYYLKIRKIKIIWTFHNRESHFKKMVRLKNCIRDFTARHADYIITHAKDGVSIVKEYSLPSHPKIRFFHHPILPNIDQRDAGEKVYDILIWGAIKPYKGIEHFLRFVGHEKLEHLKILVAGKIDGKSYRDEILSYRSNQIEIIDKFISEEELGDYIAKSRSVLFTYLEYSILSSGALMDTLRYAPVIIGPHVGAFKDLYDEGLIITYEDYSHLKSILNNLSEYKSDVRKIHKFNHANSWENFGVAVYNFIHSE